MNQNVNLKNKQDILLELFIYFTSYICIPIPISSESWIRLRSVRQGNEGHVKYH